MLPLLKTPISRRAFLRGTGAALSLPFLEAMLPRAARAQGAGGARCNVLAFYVPNGMHMPAWTPAGLGRDWAMSPILTPIAAFRDKINVISGLNNNPARPDGPGDHAGGTSGFLTAAHAFKTDGANIRLGVSIDQAIAQQVGGQSRFSSLVLGAEGGGNAGGCDSGYSCAYSRNISWVGESQPAAKETNPATLFDRLFGTPAGVDPVAAERRRRGRRSILDVVQGDVARLEARLGAADRRKLDQYLTGVREVERQIDLAENQRCDAGVRPERPEIYVQTIEQLIDLTVLALQCNQTQVVTFMLANAGSNRSFPFLDIAEGHHQLSHHQGNPDNHAKLQRINTWELGMFQRLLAGLDAVDRGGQTLLDESVVFFSSEIEDGNAHRHTNLPVVLAGGASGQLATGRHLDAAGAPMGNLFTTLGQLAGADIAQFGDDGTGALDLS